MSNLERFKQEYSEAIVKLLKGATDRNSKVWDKIINYQNEIEEYVAQIGLELIVKKDEGFAFLKQIEYSDGNTLGLITRRQIGFETSIILVVLRQSLEEFDRNPTQFQVAEKFINDSEIKEELELFLEEGYNRLRFLKDLDKYIKNVVDLGYLKEVLKKDNETTCKYTES
jgi:hypothetical protein